MAKTYEITTSNRKTYLKYNTNSKVIAILIKIITEATFQHSGTDFYIPALKTSYIFRMRGISLMKKINSKYLENFQPRI